MYCLSVLLIALFPDSKLSVYDNVFHGNIIMSYIISSLLVISIMFICKGIKSLPYISYVGRYSVVILLIHVPIMEIIYYIQRAIIGYEANWLRLVLTMTFASVMIPFMIKFFPYITAQKDLLSYDKLRNIVNRYTSATNRGVNS